MPAVLSVGAEADVHPVGAFAVMLPDELVEVAVLHDPRHPLAALLDVAVYAEVCRLALDVLRVRDATHGLVQLWATVARAYLDCLAHSVAQGLQHVMHQGAQIAHLVNARSVDDVLLLGGCAGGQLVHREILPASCRHLSFSAV